MRGRRPRRRCKRLESDARPAGRVYRVIAADRLNEAPPIGLTLDNAAQAIEWYKKALGAEEVSRVVGPDGKITHTEMRSAVRFVMLNDAMGGSRGPKAIGGSPASLWIYVKDCDALFKRAVAASAQVLDGPMGAMGDQFWGDRSGTFTDPMGTAGRSRHAKKISRRGKWSNGSRSG